MMSSRRPENRMSPSKPNPKSEPQTNILDARAAAFARGARISAFGLASDFGFPGSDF
jgi:hypothetical protein